MSMRPEASDPLRLLEEQSSEGVPLRTLLQSAAEDGPTAEQVERLVTQLDQTLLEGGEHASEAHEGDLGEPLGSMAGGGAGMGGLAKGAVAAGVVLAVGAAVIALRAPVPSTAVPSTAASPTAEPTAGEEHVVSEEPEAEDEAASEPLGRGDSEREIIVPDSSQEAEVPRAGPSPRGTSAVAPAVKEVPSEIRLLSDAQAALARRDGAAALALTAEHQRAYPRGTYREEMDRIAIEALLQLGRRAEATSRAERFLQRFPRSVHRQRIEVLLDQPSEGRARVPPGR